MNKIREMATSLLSEKIDKTVCRVLDDALLDGNAVMCEDVDGVRWIRESFKDKVIDLRRLHGEIPVVLLPDLLSPKLLGHG